MVPTNNSKAVIGLVMGIAAVVFAFCCSFLGIPLGIGAAVLGYQSKTEIAQSGGAQGGAGIAQAAFVTGIAGTALAVVMMILSLVMNIGSAAGSLFGM